MKYLAPTIFGLVLAAAVGVTVRGFDFVLVDRAAQLLQGAFGP